MARELWTCSSGRTRAGEERILLDGEDVTGAIRTETAGAAASRVAAMPPVRTALLERQRAFARPPGLVADGRDMGTVVFPDAALKIYLTASADERARRRHKQLKEKGLTVNLADLSQEIRERDRRDSSRPVAPLRPAEDAVDRRLHGAHDRAGRGPGPRARTEPPRSESRDGAVARARERCRLSLAPGRKPGVVSSTLCGQDAREAMGQEAPR